MGPLVRLPEKRPGKTVGLIRDPSGPLRNWSAFREETVTAPLWMAGECPGARAEYAGSLGTSSLSGFSRHLPLTLGHGDGEQTKPEDLGWCRVLPGHGHTPAPSRTAPTCAEGLRGASRSHPRSAFALGRRGTLSALPLPQVPKRRPLLSSSSPSGGGVPAPAPLRTARSSAF